MGIEQLLNKTIIKITGCKIGSEQVRFTTSDGDEFLMYHREGCCESVDINDIVGNPNDILNSPILQAEEVSNENEEPKPSEWAESWTWTFYKLTTVNGYISIKWLGESNGYYSESVDFIKQ